MAEDQNLEAPKFHKIVIISPSGRKDLITIPLPPPPGNGNAEWISKDFRENVKAIMCVSGMGFQLRTKDGVFVDLSQPWSIREEDSPLYLIPDVEIVQSAAFVPPKPEEEEKTEEPITLDSPYPCHYNVRSVALSNWSDVSGGYFYSVEVFAQWTHFKLDQSYIFEVSRNCESLQSKLELIDYEPIGELSATYVSQSKVYFYFMNY